MCDMQETASHTRSPVSTRDMMQANEASHSRTTGCGAADRILRAFPDFTHSMQNREASPPKRCRFDQPDAYQA